MRVKATNEGLIGGRTASGYIIDKVVPFVALPAEAALGRLVCVVNSLTGGQCYAFVLDVGPWYTNDTAYVFNGARPEAESNPKTNGSGIDLGYKVWVLLGMADNTDVDWWFV
jgi:hypothetical protein